MYIYLYVCMCVRACVYYIERICCFPEDKWRCCGYVLGDGRAFPWENTT